MQGTQSMRDDRSVSAEEVARFAALAPQWWDESGPMRPLHQMNPLRVDWVTSHIRARCGAAPVRVLDMGCGGGIAAEALAARGFDVTGIDAAPEAIGVARAHAVAGGLTIDYRIGLAADLAAAGEKFAAVTALEIIEHVPDQADFLRVLAALLQPEGMLFISTLNRSLFSLAIGKIGAEYIARLLPAGTHDWRKFVKPAELAALGRAAGLRMSDVSGMVYRGEWVLSRDVSMNYVAVFEAG